MDAQAELEAQKKAQDVRKALGVRATHRARNSNLDKTRLSDDAARRLDSSLKKCTALVKKLKTVSEDNKDALCSDVGKYNLSRYVSEMVAAVCEVRFKPDNIAAVAQLCSMLHSLYKDFAPQLLGTLERVFVPAAKESDAERTARLGRRRMTMRVLIELYLLGVHSNMALLADPLREYLKVDLAQDAKDGTSVCATLFLSFFKAAADDLLGITPAKQHPIVTKARAEARQQHPELQEPYASKAQQDALAELAQTFFDKASALAARNYLALRRREAENNKLMHTKGEVPEKLQTAYDDAKKAHDKLWTTLTSFADAMCYDAPALPAEEKIAEKLGKVQFVQPEIPQHVEGGVFEDEDTRSFYEDLPDLVAVLPSSIVDGGKAMAKEKAEAEAEAKKKEEAEDKDKDEAEAKGDDDELPVDGPQEPTPELLADEDDEDKESDAPKSSVMDGLLDRMSACVRRDLVDAWALEFCYHGNKGNRKRLVRALFRIPRGSSFLVPYYARLAATLDPVFPDIGPALVAMLEREFFYHFSKKDQLTLEDKVKTVKYLCELVKFKICPPNLIFRCLKACLDNFSHHQIDMACTLIELCGRFLYMTLETTVRMSTALDRIQRLKTAKHLDPRLEVMIENAYNTCRPPERPARAARKQRTDLQEYVRHLVFSQLSAATVDTVAAKIAKLPRTDESLAYVIKTVGKVHKVTHANIPAVAELLLRLGEIPGLAHIVCAVIDDTFENIRAGLVRNDFRDNQQRISQMIFLGELSNHRLVDAQAVFAVLHLLIGDGDPICAQFPDPREDNFRSLLALVLLETALTHLSTSLRKHIRRFVVRLCKYTLVDHIYPGLEVEQKLHDLCENVLPDLVNTLPLHNMDPLIKQLGPETLVFPDPAVTTILTVPESIPVLRKGQVVLEEAPVAEMAEAARGEDDADDDDGDDEDDDEDDDDEDDDDEEGDDDDDDDDDEDDEDDETDSDEEEDPGIDEKELEEIEFDQMMRKMMSQSLESRKQEARRAQALTVPMDVFGSTAAAAAAGAAQRPTTTFKVLTRKNNKPVTRDLEVPTDSSMAHSNRIQTAALRREQQEMKRLVLAYEKREAMG